jgi:hypothetical protein
MASNLTSQLEQKLACDLLLSSAKQFKSLYSGDVVNGKLAWEDAISLCIPLYPGHL